MSFVKTYDEILGNARETADFYDAEMITIFWETDPEVIERLLPPPLKPVGRPLVTAFVANYPSTNFGVPYLESALFVRASFEGQEGSYCLAMPVTNDIAMAGGREIYGYPKKMANIVLRKDGDMVEGWTERHGIRFMKIKARLTGKTNDSSAIDVLKSLGLTAGQTSSTMAYNFKHFPSPAGGGFDYDPRLTKGEVVFRPKAFTLAEAEIELIPSEFDPWHELPVKRMLGGFYSVGDNSMLKGSVVAEVDPAQFAPYAFLKWEWPAASRNKESQEQGAEGSESSSPSPAQAEATTTSGTAEAVKMIFSLMPENLNVEAARGMDVVIQYNLKDEGGGTYHAVIRDGVCTTGEGPHASPTMTITIKAQDYVDMAMGKLDGRKAFMTGKLKVGGDMGLAMKLSSLFKTRSS